MSRDYYEEARQIAQALEVAGLRPEADSIRAAIGGGSTATEKLMALRWNLQRLETAAVAPETKLRRRISDLRLAIDGALNA